MHLVIDDKIPFIRSFAECLGETVYLPGAKISADDVCEADALIIRTRTRCDRALLEGSRVKFIATATIGFDHIDTTYLNEAGIAWTNCPGCNAPSVAQYVESCLLLLAQAGKLTLASTTTLGIVGVGHVGACVAAMATRLGLRVLLCDPPRLAGHGGVATGSPAAYGTRDEDCRATLSDVCREADIITFHTPLTRSGQHPTFHLANAAFFASLCRRPVLINAARGEVVDTTALLTAIAARQVSDVVIDTWENEPHISPQLLEAAFIATPHIAGYSADGKATGTRMALTAVAHHFHLPADFSAVQPPAVPADFRYNPADTSPSLDPRLALYDPRRDTAALRAHPADFERLRGDYPLRREHF